MITPMKDPVSYKTITKSTYYNLILKWKNMIFKISLPNPVSFLIKFKSSSIISMSPNLTLLKSFKIFYPNYPLFLNLLHPKTLNNNF